MSKPVNPYTIGAFLVGSVALLIVAILVFGSGKLLKKKSEYVIYFDGAINGLNVGVPVKLQGVQIGTVKEISIELDQKATRITKPVVIEIDQEMVLDSGGHTDLIRSIIATRDGKQIVSAGEDKTIRVWSVTTGEPLRTIRASAGRDLTPAFRMIRARWLSNSADFSAEMIIEASFLLASTLRSAREQQSPRCHDGQTGRFGHRRGRGLALGRPAGHS